MRVTLRKHRLSLRHRKLKGWLVLVWMNDYCTIHKKEQSLFMALVWAVYGLFNRIETN